MYDSILVALLVSDAMVNNVVGASWELNLWEEA